MDKKILSFFGMVWGSFAMAGSMGPVCAPGAVTVPCEMTQWEIDIQALYLKPAYDPSLGFAPRSISQPAALAAGFAGAVTDSTGVQRINPNWGWGYRLEGRYGFSTGLDIDINWSHYNVNSHLGSFFGQYMQLIREDSPSLIALPLIPVEANYKLSLTNAYDQVNLVMGQMVDMGLRKHSHFYGGLQYVNIRVDNKSTFTVTDPLFLVITGGGVIDYISTDFKGLGPVVGIDYAYDLFSGLSITANTAASLLYGVTRLDFATAYANGLVVSPTYGSRRSVVTGLEAKIGANYAYAFASGLFNLQGGYQAVNYFDGLDAMPILLGPLAKSSFGLFGPYFGLSYRG